MLFACEQAVRPKPKTTAKMIKVFFIVLSFSNGKNTKNVDVLGRKYNDWMVSKPRRGDPHAVPLTPYKRSDVVIFIAYSTNL